MAAAGLGAQLAIAQTCTYPVAATLSGYTATFTGTLAAATSTRLNFPVVCAGVSALSGNTFTALVVVDLPDIGSPVSIDTCGSDVDTLISGAGSRDACLSLRWPGRRVCSSPGDPAASHAPHPAPLRICIPACPSSSARSRHGVP